MRVLGNGGSLSALLLAALLAAGCAPQQTPAERAAEQPDPQAPPAAPADIGLEEKVEVPDIDVDTEVRMPKRR